MTADPASPATDPAGEAHPSERGRLLLACAAVVALAALARAALSLRLPLLQPDGCWYVWIAEDIASGDWARALAQDKPPLYPAIAALAHLASGLTLERAATLVSILLGSCASLPILCAAGRVSGDAGGPPVPRALVAGACAGALHALQPEAVRAGADVMSEATFALFAATSLALGLRALETRSLAAALLCGLAGGIGSMARPEGLALPIAIGITMLVTRAFGEVGAGKDDEHESTTARKLSCFVPSCFRVQVLGPLLLALALGTLVGALPYAAAISIQDGEVKLTRKKSLRDLVGLGPTAPAPAQAPAPAPPTPTSVPVDPYALLHGAPYARPAGFGPALARLASASLHALSALASAAHPAILALALWGALLARRRPALRATLLAICALTALGALVDFSAGYVSRRHLATAGALACIPAGVGLADLLARIAAPRLRLAAVIALAALLGAKALAPRFEHRAGHLEAGAWLRANGGPGALAVCLYGTEVAYYGGAREVPWRHGPTADVLARARAQGARFAVIVVRARGEESGAAKDGASLLEHEMAALGLAAAYRAEEPVGDRRYVRLIYRI